MSKLTLVLTPWMAVHSTFDWKDAITAQYLKKVDVLEVYSETVSSPSMTMSIPAVVRLKKAVSPHKKGIKFSRLNVFTRDGFKCQYCGVKKSMKELNYDHVIPRAQGGKTMWGNVVSSCYKCNSTKDCRTPQQAGMKLLKEPYRPKTLPMTAPIVSLKEIPEEWKFYLPDESAVILSHTG